MEKSDILYDFLLGKESEIFLVIYSNRMYKFNLISGAIQRIASKDFKQILAYSFLFLILMRTGIVWDYVDINKREKTAFKLLPKYKIIL